MRHYAGAVLEQLSRVFNDGTSVGLTEGKLLERFVVEGDEAAFAALVARHGPMVLGVCRRILRDEHAVEDAFQATFLILVRRAGAIKNGELVGHWLYGVAHRVAVSARAQTAYRSVHETTGLEISEFASGRVDTDVDQRRRELVSVLDEAVARLTPNFGTMVFDKALLVAVRHHFRASLGQFSELPRGKSTEGSDRCQRTNGRS